MAKQYLDLDGLNALWALIKENFPKLEDGLIPASFLPGYVDDVIEGYYANGSFYTDSGLSSVIQPESGKLYIDITESRNTSYRWSGTQYIAIATSSSAAIYDGDGNKITETYLKLSGGSLVGPVYVRDMLPVTSDTYILGNSTYRYSSAHIKDINCVNATVDELQVNEIYAGYLNLNTGSVTITATADNTHLLVNSKEVLLAEDIESIPTSTIEALS